MPPCFSDLKYWFQNPKYIQFFGTEHLHEKMTRFYCCGAFLIYKSLIFWNTAYPVATTKYKKK